MSHLHVYLNVRKVLDDAAKHAYDSGNWQAANFLYVHAEKFSYELVCHKCGHKWSL